jgi:hypothetical protein
MKKISPKDASILTAIALFASNDIEYARTSILHSFLTTKKAKIIAKDLCRGKRYKTPEAQWLGHWASKQRNVVENEFGDV